MSKQTHINLDDLLKQRDELVEIIRALMTNPHIDLGDQIYQVRERECLGWEGPSVKAWGDAVAKADVILKERALHER